MTQQLRGQDEHSNNQSINLLFTLNHLRIALQGLGVSLLIASFAIWLVFCLNYFYFAFYLFFIFLLFFFSLFFSLLLFLLLLFLLFFHVLVNLFMCIYLVWVQRTLAQEQPSLKHLDKFIAAVMCVEPRFFIILVLVPFSRSLIWKLSEVHSVV